MFKNRMQNSDVNKEELEQLWNLTGSYHSTYQPNVEKGLAQLKARINQDKGKATPIHVAFISRRLWITRVAAVIAFVVGLGVVVNFFLNSDIEMKEVAATENLLKNYTLPDGSVIWLNKNSKLNFPEKFAATTREVYLEGEAFFKIAKNENQPFIVRTPNSEVQVLGTAFILNASPNEKTVTLKVEEGKVLFKVLDLNQSETLVASENLVYNTETKELKKLSQDIWKETAWKEEQLNFIDTPVSEVFSYLENNFQIQFEIENNRLDRCSFNSTKVNNEPTAILKQLENAFPQIVVTQIENVQSKLYRVKGRCQ